MVVQGVFQSGLYTASSGRADNTLTHCQVIKWPKINGDYFAFKEPFVSVTAWSLSVNLCIIWI